MVLDVSAILYYGGGQLAAHKAHVAHVICVILSDVARAFIYKIKIYSTSYIIIICISINILVLDVFVFTYVARKPIHVDHPCYCILDQSRLTDSVQQIIFLFQEELFQTRLFSS